MPDNSNRLSLLDWISLTLATWFSTGLLPVMPGTWGTLFAIPFVLVFVILLEPVYYVAFVIVLVLIGIPVSSRTAQLYREHPRIMKLNPHLKKIFKSEDIQKYIKNPELQKKDPGLIVIDEVIGYAVAMIAVPLSITSVVAVFILFRFFDIVKIQPGKIVERLGGGVGIILDDVVAGIYACILIHVILWIWGVAQLPAWP